MLHYYESQIHDKVVDFCFHSLCINFLLLSQIALCFKLPKVEVIQLFLHQIPLCFKLPKVEVI